MMSARPRAALARARAVVAAAVLGLTAAACAGPGTVPADTVRIVLPEEPPTLEACDASLTGTGVVVRSNITEPLAERNPATGGLEPLLATSWTQTSPTMWTFTLREGVTFSDGTPFDAAAAAFSIDRAVNSDIDCNVQGYVFGDTLEAAAPNATTLVVTSPTPDPILPLRLSFVEMVHPSTPVDAKEREPIGTGPYRIAAWQPGIRLTLERNPGYWGSPPPFARAEYEWRSDSSVRAAMVVNGEADIATGIGAEDGAGELGVSFPNNETTALRLQATEPPLDDIRVRRAIGMVIDKDGIISALLEGAGTPAAQLIPDGVIGYNPDLRPEPFDPARAETLMDEVRADGVDLSAPIRFIVRSGLFPRVSEVTQAIQYQLSQLGLNVQIQMMDSAEGLEYQQRPFPEGTGAYILMIQHGNQAGDAAFTLDQYMLSDGYQSSFGTAGFDAAIAAAEAMSGPQRQDALAELFAREPEKIDQYAYIAHMRGMLARSPRVHYEPDSATGDEMRLAAMSPA
ncbi:ABC transporter substrate-binding protein [Pseudonocardia sp. DLS-67]